MKKDSIQTFQVTTSAKTDLIDITGHVQKVVQNLGVRNGVCFVYTPHTTAAVTINENADPAVVQDMLMALNKMVPSQDRYRHLEGNSPAHVKASLIGGSETLFVESGKLVLGTWQGIFFCEFDGPRSRNIHIKVLRDEE